MINKIHKQKIPKDYSYVIKTSQIEEIINIYDIKTAIDLNYYRDRIYWREKEDNIILETDFWKPDLKYEFNRYNTYIYPVIKDKADIIRKQIAESVLPEFVKWMKEIEDIEESSTLFYEKHYFKAKLQDDKILIDKE